MSPFPLKGSFFEASFFINAWNLSLTLSGHFWREFKDSKLPSILRKHMSVRWTFVFQKFQRGDNYYIYVIWKKYSSFSLSLYIFLLVVWLVVAFVVQFYIYIYIYTYNDRSMNFFQRGSLWNWNYIKSNKKRILYIDNIYIYIYINT